MLLRIRSRILKSDPDLVKSRPDPQHCLGAGAGSRKTNSWSRLKAGQLRNLEERLFWKREKQFLFWWTVFRSIKDSDTSYQNLGVWSASFQIRIILIRIRNTDSKYKWSQNKRTSETEIRETVEPDPKFDSLLNCIVTHCSVAEPPLFWVAPEVWGTGVNSCYGQMGSAHGLKFVILIPEKVNY